MKTQPALSLTPTPLPKGEGLLSPLPNGGGRRVRVNLEPWLAAGLLTIVTALTYGILIPQLGFYHDDWYMLFAGQSEGLAGIIRLFQTDRPLIGWVYALVFKFIGPNVLAWQLYALILKIISGLAVWGLLRLVWPAKRLETTCAALLFVLYPGFYQQPVAATFVTDLLGLDAAFISIALTIYALDPKGFGKPLGSILATLAAAALGLFYIALYEATIGLEVVRWALVWYVVAQNDILRTQPAAIPPEGGRSPQSSIANRQSKIEVTLTTLKTLIPYLLMVAGFVFWRLFIFKSVRRATNIDVLLADYASNPLYSLSQIVFGYLKDLFETILAAWVVPFYQFTADGRYTDFLSGLALTLVVLAFVAAYIFWMRHQSAETESDPISRHFLWLGLVSVAIPSAVIILLGRNVLFTAQWDRYTSQSMFGVALLILGALWVYLRGGARWTVFFTLLFLAVMTHYHSAAYHARFWDYQRNVVWQLSWRAPGFAPDTTLIVSLPEGYRLAEEYEVWGPVNMAYYPGQPMQVSGQIPFDGMALNLTTKTKEHRLMRNFDVKRDYSKPLALSMPSQNSCVHVLDGQQLALPFFESSQVKEIASFSNIALIDLAATPVTPSAAIFGAEPEHGWCYYYQKIGLALQAGHAAEAARLADESAQKGLKPSDETEWLPVVAAYAQIGQDAKAAASAKEIDKNLRKYICLQQAAQTSQPGANLTYRTLCPGN